jgi:predicted glycogen debranching enzyme
MDDESCLVFSPRHFTWMDTNYPAGTPREGYPVEIQALWYASLRFAAAVAGRDDFRDLAERAKSSVVRYFWERRYPATRWLADCLHAKPGESAGQARPDDALRPNQLLAVTLGAVDDATLMKEIISSCAELAVPGAMRSLADRHVEYPIPVRHSGQLLNDPRRPYWPFYSGDEDTRRKPAYHNGTAWSWLFPSYCEAIGMCYGPGASSLVRGLLGSFARVIEEDCLGHVPEILDGDRPHRAKGCGAQAWGATELYRILARYGEN